MAYAPRPTGTFPTTSSTASSMRQASVGSQSSQQSNALATRIASKRNELENLKQLRDLSGALAGQMSMLEEKLATLRDGTEAVACVLANWENVLRAISLASMKVPAQREDNERLDDAHNSGEDLPLPVTLVRIPAHPADTPRSQDDVHEAASRLDETR